MKHEDPIHQLTDSPIHQLQSALEARHLANLTRSEAARALRALSSCYVERRAKLASGAPLETAGKRAAFALYYAVLHFAIVSEIVRASGLATQTTGTIHDLGCGTGVGGAAWALQCRSRPAVAGVDRSAWAVDEANWLYRHLRLEGRAVRGDFSHALRRRGRSLTAGDALLFAYALNEAPPSVRAETLGSVIAAVERHAPVLIVEPIGKRLGNAGWWHEWRTALAPYAIVEREWRFPAALLPESTRDLAKAAGLDPKELTARTLASAGG